MKRLIAIVLLANLGAWAQLPVIDAAAIEQAVQQLINIVKTYNQIKATYDHAIYQARTLGSLGRYRRRISVWQRIRNMPGGTVDPRVQVWIDAANTGINAAGAYGGMYYGPVMPYRNFNGLSPDARNRRMVDLATIQALDALGSNALDSIGQTRDKGIDNEEMMRELIFDATHDNVDNYTEAKNAQRANLFAALNSRINNDNQKLILASLEFQALRAKQERDAALAALEADVEFRDRGVAMLREQTEGASQAMRNFRLP